MSVQAQNSRFLVLAAAAKWPNLATRVLKRVGARLSQDWRERFGYPVLAVETFVDPQRFRGTCYQAAGWQLLGATQGFERTGKDFYTLRPRRGRVSGWQSGQERPTRSGASPTRAGGAV